MISVINKNFVIRYSFYNDSATFLVGAGQYSSLVGESLANKHFQTVLSNGKYKTTFRLRRGLKIDFCSK